MLTSAITTIARAGLASQIRVAHADATRFDPQPLFGVARFERIFVSYSLSMIPDWQAVIDRAIALLAPRRRTAHRRLRRPATIAGHVPHLLRRWLALFHVTPRDELEAALRTRTQAAKASLTFERPYRDYAQYAVLRLAM